MTGPAMCVNWKTLSREQWCSAATARCSCRAIFCYAPRRIRRSIAPGDTAVAVPDHGLDFERTVGTSNWTSGAGAAENERKQKASGGNAGLKRTTLTAKLKSLVAVGAAG